MYPATVLLVSSIITDKTTMNNKQHSRVRHYLQTIILAVAITIIAAGCGPQLPAEKLSGDVWTPAAIGRDLPEVTAAGPTIVACRFTHQLWQLVSPGKYYDVAEDLHRNQLAEDGKVGKVSVSRMYLIWGRASKVLAVLEAGAAKAAGMDFGDLADNLWIPSRQADAIFLPEVRKIQSRSVNNSDPMIWAWVRLDVKRLRGQYDKKVIMHTALWGLNQADGMYVHKAVSEEVYNRLGKTLDGLLFGDNEVSITTDDSWPEPFPSLQALKDKPELLWVTTPAGRFAGISDKSGEDFLAGDIGYLQRYSKRHSDIVAGSEVWDRKVADEIAGDSNAIE